MIPFLMEKGLRALPDVAIAIGDCSSSSKFKLVRHKLLTELARVLWISVQQGDSAGTTTLDNLATVAESQ